MTDYQKMNTSILAAAESAKVRAGFGSDQELCKAIGVAPSTYKLRKSSGTMAELPFGAIFLIAKYSNSELILRSKAESFT